MNNWTPNEWLELADVLFTALGIVVSTFVAYWIVISIQKKISDEQSFKAYLAHTIQQLKGNYNDLLQQLVIGKAHAKALQRDLNASDKQIHELMKLITTKYTQIDDKYFDEWIYKSRKEIEAFEEYEEAYSQDKLVKLSQKHQDLILRHKSEFEKKVNEFIILLFNQ